MKILKFSDYFIIIIIVLCTFLSVNRVNVWTSEISLWKNSYSKSPMSTRSINNFAYELMLNEDYEESKKMFLKSVTLNHFFAPSHSNLGTIYLKENNLDLAEKHLKIALKYGTDFSDLHESLGIVYYKLKRYDEALNQFKLIQNKAIYGKMANENIVVIYNDIGYEFGAQKKFIEASQYFQKALDIDSNNLNSLYGIALSFKELKNFKSALIYYEKLYRLSLDDKYRARIKKDILYLKENL